MTAAVLQAGEAAALAEHELAVERGLSTFLDVGRALLAIRDGRLYRADHATFESYCEQRWGMSKRHANRMVQAAEVAEVVGPMGPGSERQARELAPLLDQPEKLRETWEQVNEQTGGKPTAAAIREAVRPAPLPAGITKVTDTQRTETYIDSDTGEVVDPGSVPIDEHPDYQPRWQPEPPSPQSQAERDRRISAEAFSANLAKNAWFFARLARTDIASAPAHAAKYLPDPAAAYGGVDPDVLRDAARYLLALADAWKKAA